MQWLCHNDVQPGEVDETIDVIAQESAVDEDSLGCARALCRQYLSAPERIDERIVSALEHWALNRIDAVDRNVIRVATVELLDGRVPPKVALNEAIEIAREFGTADSPGFVNGVLDAIWKAANEVS